MPTSPGHSRAGQRGEKFGWEYGKTTVLRRKRGGCQPGELRGNQQEGAGPVSTGAVGTWEPLFPVPPSPLTSWEGTWKMGDGGGGGGGGGGLTPSVPRGAWMELEAVPLTTSPLGHPRVPALPGPSVVSQLFPPLRPLPYLPVSGPLSPRWLTLSLV